MLCKSPILKTMVFAQLKSGSSTRVLELRCFVMTGIASVSGHELINKRANKTV